MHINQSIRIQAAREKVFNYLAEFKNRTGFIPLLSDVRLLSGPESGVGTRYMEISRIAGQRIETSFLVTEFESPYHIAVRSISGKYPIFTRLDLEEEPSSTRLNIDIKVRLPGIAGIFVPIVKTIVDLHAEGILKNLKDKVESH